MSVISRSGTKASLALLACALLVSTSSGQGIGVNTDGSTPDPAALLDVDAGPFSKGVLLPKVRLNTSFWNDQGLSSAGFAAPNPFLSHGLANMLTSLWVYNDTIVDLPVQLFGVAYQQYSIAPGHYWWDSGASGRWVRQQGVVVPRQHYLSTGTVISTSDNSWQDVPGLESITLQLKAGDRVLISADGAFRIEQPSPPVAPAPPDDHGHVVASARLVVNGSTTLHQVRTSIDGIAQRITTQTCLVWTLFCTSNSVTYTTQLRLQNWKLLNLYTAPADGPYTFSVQIARLSGISNVTGGGTSSSNPDLRGSLNVEVYGP